MSARKLPICASVALTAAFALLPFSVEAQQARWGPSGRVRSTKAGQTRKGLGPAKDASINNMYK